MQYVTFVFGWGQTELAERYSLTAVWRMATAAMIIPSECTGCRRSLMSSQSSPSS